MKGSVLDFVKGGVEGFPRAEEVLGTLILGSRTDATSSVFVIIAFFP